MAFELRHFSKSLFFQTAVDSAAFPVNWAAIYIKQLQDLLLLDQPFIWTELYAASADNTYACRILYLDHLIIEGDSTMVVSWIRQILRSSPTQPIIQNIGLLLRGYLSITVRHIYREANSATDWMAFYITNHSRSGSVLWSTWQNIPIQLGNIILSNFLDCIHSRSIN